MLRFRAGPSCAAAVIILASLGGCASVPELTFADDVDASLPVPPDASTGTRDATLADGGHTDGATDGGDGGPSPSDASAPDAAAPDAAPPDGGPDAGADAGCVATGAVTCCGPVPCVGACAGNCSYCPTTCSAGQLCCIVLNGAGKVKRNDCVQSAADCK